VEDLDNTELELTVLGKEMEVFRFELKEFALKPGVFSHKKLNTKNGHHITISILYNKSGESL